MDLEFIQTGGLRYGDNYWYAWNFTYPFAQLRVSSSDLTLSVSFLSLWRRTFIFPRPAIRQLRWKRGLFSRGLQIEHTLHEYPPFVLFWVGDLKSLAESLREFGYEIADSNRAV